MKKVISRIVKVRDIILENKWVKFFALIVGFLVIPFPVINVYIKIPDVHFSPKINMSPMQTDLITAYITSFFLLIIYLMFLRTRFLYRKMKSQSDKVETLYFDLEEQIATMQAISIAKRENAKVQIIQSSFMRESNEQKQKDAEEKRIKELLKNTYPEMKEDRMKFLIDNLYFYEYH